MNRNALTALVIIVINAALIWYLFDSLRDPIVLPESNLQVARTPQQAPADDSTTPVKYDISFENRAHHEGRVTVTFLDLQPQTLELRMSRTSPGRYALHEFAKNVYDLRAVNSKGQAIRVSRPNPHQWNVAGHDGAVTVTYTIFGDRAGGTYLGIDNAHAHLNIPATFMWARGYHHRPVEIRFRIPDKNWTIATQLAPTSHEEIFTAPNLQYFMDSPTEIGPLTFYKWDVDGQTIQLALHHEGTDAEAEAYTTMAKAVVAEEAAIYGELPRFDFGTYTFLADYHPLASGDGMEHRNSTIISSTRSLEKGAIRNLGTLAHEFFHAWNIERIRPMSLEPFNFEEANMSGELWFGEGFTSYYDDLILRRIGVNSLDRFVRSISEVTNNVMIRPGRKLYGPVEMSRRAPFVDAARSVDPRNFSNTFISYYTYGAFIGLALDLTLRQDFPGITLDDYMRLIWETHGVDEIPYTNDDLVDALSKLTGDAQFARKFFDRHIFGHDVPPMKKLLAQAGFLLRKRDPGEAWIGTGNLKFVDDGAQIDNGTLNIAPLYKAGLDRRDIIVTLDGKALTSDDDLANILKAHEPGDRLAVTYRTGGADHAGRIRLEENPNLEVVRYEQAGMEPTPQMIEFRNAWLSSKLKTAPELYRYCGKCKRDYPMENEYCSIDGEALKFTQ